MISPSRLLYSLFLSIMNERLEVESPRVEVAYCSNLKSIIVSDSVTGFPETTFYDCTSLEKIIFGTGLKTGGVFWDSKYIKEIHCRSTIPPSIIGFNNEVYNNATLYVPKGCNEAYHTAIMWREFKTIVEE